MKTSRYYQNFLQVVGSLGDVILFFSGFFLGKEEILIACILLAIRILFKISTSEIMYRRMKAVVREETQPTRGVKK